VTTFARLLSKSLVLRPVRRLILASALATTLIAGSLVTVAPAQALVTEVEGTKVGLQPRSVGLAQGLVEGEGATFANESGNVVLHGNTGDYVIYWDPEKPTRFDNEWLANLDGFGRALGEAELDTPFGVLGQYRDRSNAVEPFHALFKGSYSDTVHYPTSKCSDPAHLAICLTDAQLREQLQSFIATHSLPKGMDTIYYVLTPPDVAVCLDETATRCSDYSVSHTEETKGERNSVSYKESFCSYHSDINPDGASEGDANTILYAAIPWVANTAAYDCQDGGWNPEKYKEKREAPKELSEKEEEAREKQLAEDSNEKRVEEEKARRLEGPHIEEPNQESGEVVHPAEALSDLLVNQIGEEELNTVTDPLLSSWHDARGEEVTDLCRDAFASTAGENGSSGEIAGAALANPFTEAGTLSNVTVGPNRYYINNVFNLATGGCVGGVGLVASFTAPNPVNAGEIIGVDGMESEVSMIEGKAFGPTGPPATTYATFSWNFGDGTPEVVGYAPGAPTCEAPWLSPCAASAFHSYQYGGKYQVTLTITDVGGNKDSVTREVEVDGPPPPSTAGGSSGGSAGSTGGTKPGGSPGAVPMPVAAAAILPQRLRNALRKGLVVSYSVNEQVAGHFEVLLSSAVAQRLKIKGASATGLPAGSPPELVIARAILVTTKGGRSAVHIDFPKSTAARLAKVHKLALMLRLIVRNAATSSPATTTVVSTATLTH
jgi:hypothetical protein